MCASRVPVAAGFDPVAASAESDLPRLLSIDEIAEHLGVNVRHMRRLVAERRIPYVKWGNLLRFDPVEVQRWLITKVVDPLPSARRHRRRSTMGDGLVLH
jgi:excisionase family DNA binding protein